MSFLQVPAHSITILLGVIFSVINPLLPPMALLYLVVVALTEKYNLLYVNRAAYQSGGKVRVAGVSIFAKSRSCSYFPNFIVKTDRNA